MDTWNVYLVRCSDGSLYTGIALDVARRVAEHNTNDVLAARYTRYRRPVMLVYQEKCDTRSAAGATGGSATGSPSRPSSLSAKPGKAVEGK